MSQFSPQLKAAIYKTAEEYGVDPNYLIRAAQIESGGNPNAKNPNSSAGGAFQFIDSTAKQYGLEDRYDPIQATNAMARLTLDNQKYLEKVLRRKPTAGELYLAHQQGAGGAAKLLRNANARASNIVGSQAVNLNGGNSNMTAGQLASLWTGKFDNVQLQNNTGQQQQAANAQYQQQAYSNAPTPQEQPSIADNPQQEAQQSSFKDKALQFGSVLSNAFTNQQEAPPQAPAMQLNPVQGVSSQQANALSELLKKIQPQFSQQQQQDYIGV
ncbi:transglycosylase SLT domain-containing protein [Bartonella tamiae]|uniref:transglycosylase SLT domain-containing protein n=1 Tax=Bartonella tamiae TaxID=373638 RepID=UPI00026E77A3|nr:hypothetical protein MEG_01812 [Bartonella tamiae Th307]